MSKTSAKAAPAPSGPDDERGAEGVDGGELFPSSGSTDQATPSRFDDAVEKIAAAVKKLTEAGMGAAAAGELAFRIYSQMGKY